MKIRVYPAQIVYVYDADTIRADVDLGFEVWARRVPLRIFGIDAPEMGTDEGRAARDFVRDLFPPGRDVIIRTHGREKYGRWLAEVNFTDPDAGTLGLADVLLDARHARPYDGGTR